jgi:RNA polymerase sigma-70 factor (ECF subfamily)
VKTRPGELIPLRRVEGMPAEMSDAALVAACAVGEPAALGALFDRHHAALFRFLGRVAPRSGGELDDLVQCTFLEVYRSAGRFRATGAVRSWIFGIAANLARHHLRGEVRRRAALADLADLAPPASARPDEQATRRELLARLADALAELPHDLRVAFVLCDLEQIPGVEAARTLGVREGTMWRRLHDARRALRAAIEGRTP